MKFFNRPVQLGDKKTATGAALAVTANGQTFDIATESLTTAAAGTAAYVITNNRIGSQSKVLVNVGFGTSTTGTPVVQKVVVASGTVTVTILNTHASAALNGTVKITGFIMNPGDAVNA